MSDGWLVRSKQTTARLHSLTHSRSLSLTLFVRQFVGSFVRWFVRSLVRSFNGWFVGLFVRWFVGSMVQWLVRWFVGSLVRWFGVRRHPEVAVYRVCRENWRGRRVSAVAVKVYVDGSIVWLFFTKITQLVWQSRSTVHEV